MFIALKKELVAPKTCVITNFRRALIVFKKKHCYTRIAFLVCSSIGTFYFLKEACCTNAG
jgi:hypothetical protein